LAEFAERTKPRAQFVDEAINQALQSRWAEAVQVNRAILDRFGPDEETLNRLGKAYTELGQFDDAITAYEGSLKVNPVNPIAQKNLARLHALRSGKAAVPTSRGKLDVDAFIEETGKTALTALHVHADADACSKVSGGDPVTLIPDGDSMLVQTGRGISLGHLDHVLGRRLIKLIDGGNRYSGAVATCEGTSIKIILRETYQDPKLHGKPSFPVKKGGREEFRPYAKESLIARTGEVEETDDESEDASEDLEGMHTLEGGEDDVVETPEPDEDTRKEDVY
jgi:tetratricopeptide (TPR) repeat protein